MFISSVSIGILASIDASRNGGNLAQAIFDIIGGNAGERPGAQKANPGFQTMRSGQSGKIILDWTAE